MNTIVSMHHSPLTNKDYPVQKLTRREELAIELRVVEDAIRDTEEHPDWFTLGFLETQKAKKDALLKELIELER